MIVRHHALVLALALAAGPAAAQETTGPAAGHDMSLMEGMSPTEGEADAASKAYMDAMTQMSTEMETMEMTGDAGIDYAMMMIPHHQSAIDMARSYLESDDADPELTELSNEIIASQEQEIARLEAWLEQNRD